MKRLYLILEGLALWGAIMVGFVALTAGPW